jgi:hypothetical protein
MWGMLVVHRPKLVSVYHVSITFTFTFTIPIASSTILRLQSRETGLVERSCFNRQIDAT